MTINVLLADDHWVVLRGLQFFLERQDGIRVVGHAMDGEEAVRLAEQLQPDVVLMDIKMPVMDGIEAAGILKRRQPHIKVVILTSFSDQDAVIPAIRAGAVGYQLKDVQPHVLVETIRAAVEGSPVLHPQAANQLMLRAAGGDEAEKTFMKLTPKEREVLQLITHGLSNKEIAASLGIAEKTVKTHVTSILTKMDVQDRTQAAICAIRNGWFDR